MRSVLMGLLLVATSAQAETWQQIAQFESKGSVMFLDTAGMTRAGQHRLARLKLVYDSDQAIPDTYGDRQPNAVTYRWDTNDYDLDCSQRTVALSRSILHSAEDQVVGRIDIPKRARRFILVHPGTAVENIFETVCNWGEAREGITGAPTQVTSAANPIDFYPAGSVGRKEQGTPIIEACVGPDNQLLREPVVAGSSGFPLLDAAAIKVAKATRYSAGTENGIPLPESCIKFKVKFVLKE
jgi:TonB family protein